MCVSGDSIGDCFALIEADIGLTTKSSGTDVAKDTSDVEIADDLQMILECMKMGRNLFENIRKFIQF